MADGALVEYNSLFHDAVTNEDALKFTNINENISAYRYGKALAIERRPLIDVTDTLFFKIWKTTQRSYQLKLAPENIYHPDLMAYFQDSYLGTSNAISLLDTTVINFAIDGNAASAASNRFRIVFRPVAVLPVTFSSVKAFAVNNNVQVEWKAEGQANTIQFEVEKSINGSGFSHVNTTLKNTSGSYSWLDENAVTGKNFYRIKSIDRDGSIKYSAVVSVMISKNTINFTIEPNPVKGNSISLHFANQPTGNYQFNLINSAGQLVYRNKLVISSSSTSQVLNINKILPAGIYQLQIAGLSGTETQKVIIQQ